MARLLRNPAASRTGNGPAIRRPARLDTREELQVTDVMDRTSVKTYKQLIGGEAVDSASGETLDIENPANGQVIAKVPASSAEDVDRAVDAAEKAFESWKTTTPQDRSLLLLKIADSLEARAEELGGWRARTRASPWARPSTR